MEASDVIVKIGGDVSAFQEGIGGLFSSLTEKIAAINPVVAGVAGAVVGIGTAAVNIAEQYRESFATIQTGTGATGEALEGLKEDFKAVFLNTEIEGSVIAKAIADVNTRLQLTGPILQEVTDNFANMADLLGEDTTKVIESVSQAFNDWGIAAEDTAASQDFLFKTSQATGASVSELGAELARSGPTLRQFGLSFEESAVMIGELQRVGPGASAAMSGLTKAVANMTDAGIPAKDALRSIIAEIKDAPTDTDAAAAGMEVFGMKAGPQLAAQIREGKLDFDAMLASIRESPNTIASADEAADSFSAHLTVLWKNVQDLLEPLGTGLIAAGDAAVLMFTDLFGWVSDSGGAFSGLMEFIQPVADFFTGTLAPVVVDFTSLITGLAMTIGEMLTPVLSFIWQNILVPLGGFLRDVFVAQWTVVTKAIGGFLDVLKMIPGVSDLFEKGQKALAGTLKETEKATGDADKAVSGYQKSAKTAADALTKHTVPAVRKVSTELKAAKNAKDDAKKAAEALEKSHKLVTETSKRLAHEQKEAAKEAEKHAKELERLIQKGLDMDIAFQPIPPLLGNIKTTMGDLSNTIDEATRRAWDGERAMKEMGITPRSELDQLAANAETNFNKIKESGIASPQQIDQAWVTMLQARKDALIAAGTDLPPIEQQTLDALLQKQKDFKNGSTGPSGVFTEWAAGIKSLTGTLGTDMIKNLFDDPGSFGGSLKNKLVSIKDSFVDTFTTQIGGIIDNFIQKGLNAVMGALDGMIGKLTGTGGLQSALTSVFGGGTSAASNAASSIGGGGASAGGGAASSAATGVAGWMSGIGAIGSFVTGLIGNFQNAKMETTLNAIEHNTRYTMMYIGERADGGVLGELFRLREELTYGHTSKATLEIRDWIKADVVSRLGDITYNTHWSLAKLEDMAFRIPQGLDRIADSVPTVNVSVTLDGAQIASRIEERITRAGNLAIA